jgi:hypothetical protein
LDSNEIDQCDLQDEKHDDPRISAFRGILIHSSNEPENASNSIRFNSECQSNEIERNSPQSSLSLIDAVIQAPPAQGCDELKTDISSVRPLSTTCRGKNAYLSYFQSFCFRGSM